MRNIPRLGRVWYAGDHKDVLIDVYDENDVLKPVDGSSATFQLFRGEDLLLSKGMSDGISITGAVITVPFEPADTQALGGSSFEVLKYECEITDAYGNVSTVARGLFTVTADLVA